MGVEKPRSLGRFLKFSFVPIILAILHRVAGQGGWFGARYVNKIGTGLFLGLVSYSISHRWIDLAGLLISNFAVTSLPLTRYGSKLSDHWFNWVWIPIVMYINALILLPIAIIEGKLELLLILGIGYSSLMTSILYSSNLRGTKDFLLHPWFELSKGFSLGLLFLLVKFGSL